MKLISINIEANKHCYNVLDFITKEKPEVVCLQELLEEDFDRFKEELNKSGVFKASGYFFSDIPRYKDIRDKKHGVAIFAKNIFDSGSIFYEGKEENISKPLEEYLSDEKIYKNHVLLWADIKDSNDVLFKFIVTQMPVTKEGESSPYQLEVLNSLLIELSSLGEFVLCGDMNAPRGKETFRRLAEKYKDNIPLEYKTSIDQNLHRVKGVQFMIDSLFTTPAYKASNVRLVDGVSDHMAVVADVYKDQ